jgi:hypothetical protein
MLSRDISKEERSHSPKEMPTQRLTPEIISAAILGFEEQKRKIDSRIGDLRAMLDGKGSGSALIAEVRGRRRRALSAVARKRIGRAQRRRWTASHKQFQPVIAKAPKKKRRLSAAGRRAIIAATKKRWAAIKAAKGRETKKLLGARKVTAKYGAVKKAA